MAIDPDSRRDQNDFIRFLQRAWEGAHPGDSARKDWQAALAVSAGHRMGFSDEELHLTRRLASLYPLWEQSLSTQQAERYEARFGEALPARTVIGLIKETSLVPEEPPAKVVALVLAVIDYVAVKLGGEALSTHPTEITEAIDEAARLIQPLEARLKRP